MIDLLIGLGLGVILLGNGILLGRTIERRRAPAPRAAFEDELQAYLKRHNYVLATREMAAQAWPGIIESPYVPRGKAIFVHPDTLARLTRETGPDLFRPPDNKHLPGCLKRHDSKATCICGERGFGGASPMPPKFAEEWRRLHEDAPRPFLKTCPHAWDDQRAEPHTIPVHECTLSVAIHGPKCVCRCGATAAYAPPCTHSIGCPAHLTEPCPPKPEGDGA